MEAMFPAAWSVGWMLMKIKLISSPSQSLEWIIYGIWTHPECRWARGARGWKDERKMSKHSQIAQMMRDSAHWRAQTQSLQKVIRKKFASDVFNLWVCPRYVNNKTYQCRKCVCWWFSQLQIQSSIYFIESSSSLCENITSEKCWHFHLVPSTQAKYWNFCAFAFVDTFLFTPSIDGRPHGRRASQPWVPESASVYIDYRRCSRASEKLFILRVWLCFFLAFFLLLVFRQRRTKTSPFCFPLDHPSVAVNESEWRKNTAKSHKAKKKHREERMWNVNFSRTLRCLSLGWKLNSGWIVKKEKRQRKGRKVWAKREVFHLFEFSVERSKTKI